MSFDLSKLPLPNSISKISYEDNLMKLIKKFKGLEPSWDAYLESDPVIKIFEACAYALTIKDQQRNDQIKAILIASAEEADLDNLGALLAEERQADEGDDRYRTRVIKALSKVSSAGAAGAYESLALEADSRVVDVIAFDDDSQPAKAFVAIQSNEQENGVATAELLAIISAYLNHQDRKPLGVQVVVSSIEAVNYSIDAVVRLEKNVDKQMVLDTMLDNVKALVDNKKRIAAEIAISEIYASLNIEGVAVVEELNIPATNIKTSNIQVPFCTNIDISEVDDD